MWELSIAQQISGGGIADDIEIGVCIVHLEFGFGRSGCLGIEIKDSHFNVIWHSEFVPVQKDDCCPVGIQIVENTGEKKICW
jgi:hypothetical protein